MSVTVSEVMSKGIETTGSDMNLIEAARKMKEYDIGFLIVADESKVAGVITDRDIVVRGVASPDFDKLNVGDVMTTAIEKIRSDATVDDAATLMEQKQVRRLVAVDDDGRYVGVISLGDLAVKGDTEKSGETLKQVSKN